MQTVLIPNVSVDCVVFGFDLTNLNVLLIDRNFTKEGIVYDEHKLPGDLIQMNEDLDDAARRILKEETCLSDLKLKQFRSFGSPNRLKRNEHDLEWLRQNDRTEEHIITIAYYSLINMSGLNSTKQMLSDKVKLCPVNEIIDLVMDHMDILKGALEHLRVELLSQPIAFDLLPEKFTLSQMQKLYEVILGKTFDKRNFRKKFANMKYLIPLNEKQVGVAHSPARLYTFSHKEYIKTLDIS
jgi:ADP-ribose pyrophosphatase YjhB (NUDIX family)